MLSMIGSAHIFLHSKPVDMRKSFEGLSSLVEQHFNCELTGGAYFAFVNKGRDKIKVLYWDGDGLAIWYKRLEKGRFIVESDGNVSLDRREFLMLLEGVSPKRLSRRYRHA